MILFDEVAEKWEKDPVRLDRSQKVADLIRRRVPLRSDWQALEFGCGTAQLSFFLRGELQHITLVDTSEGMLRVVRRKIAAAEAVNLTPLLADLTREQIPAGPFDLIYTMMVLHHLPAPEAIFPVFRTLLKPGGYLVVAELEKGQLSFHGEDFEGHDGFTRAELTAMAVQAGLAVERVEDCFGIRRETDGVVGDFNVVAMTCRRSAA
jgi:ubiquinone/menaquinone biosynthesis C-methylase UbiE